MTKEDKKEIYIDDLCAEWSEISQTCGMYFNQYLKAKQDEGYTIVYTDNKDE